MHKERVSGKLELHTSHTGVACRGIGAAIAGDIHPAIALLVAINARGAHLVDEMVGVVVEGHNEARVHAGGAQ